MDQSLADQIAEACLKKFKSLPKQGKPKDTEWTVLSCFFIFQVKNPEKFKIISLATGTKCLDGDTRDKSLPGTLIHDSHAEVLAKRAFQHWLLDQAENVEKSEYVRKLPCDKFIKFYT